MAMDLDVSMLKATEDSHGGVFIDSDALPQDDSVFLASLKHSVTEWKKKEKRGVWLKVPRTKSELVPLAVKEGFVYDQNDRTYTMLVKWISVLKATEDNHGGVIIDSEALPQDEPVFRALLKHSLTEWKNEGKRGVWLKVPLTLSKLVPLAVKEGFEYHHAEPTYLMLKTWLATDIPSTIPANASHTVGVGAFVLNSNGEVLAVQEKCGVFKGEGIWKMPTGTVNQGEDIFAGAIREVKEETGIDTEFVQVVGFRQSHNSKAAFGKSDLFFMCVLRPLSSEITLQDTELAAAKWMPLAEYGNQGYLKKRPLLKKMFDVCVATTEDPAYKGFKVEDMQAGTGRSPQNFYYGG